METRVTDTRVWPNSPHGHLVISVQGRVDRASGVLVGPRHVLTAAHNLDGTELPKIGEIRFNPGQNVKLLPFGSHRVARAEVPGPWREARDPAWDLALLILGSAPGEKAGFYDVASTGLGKLRDREIAITGYPVRYPAEMWRRIGRVLAEDVDRLLYTNRTAKGDSGAAVYIRPLGGRLTVVGIHRYLGEAGSEGVRLTPPKLAFIRKHLV